MLSVRRNGNGNGRGRRSVSLSNLPPLTALYRKRQSFFVDRKPARDYGNLAGLERTATRDRLRHAVSAAGRVIFYALVAVWCGLAFGTVLDMALRATR
jgi:hypothetical protein